MHEFKFVCVTVGIVVSLFVGTETRADFAYVLADAGTTESLPVNDGPGPSASAQYDSVPGLDFTIHSKSSASITTDGAGNPSFHLQALADYSGPASLIGSFSRSTVNVFDTITFTGADVGTQILGFLRIRAEGFLSSNGGNKLGRLLVTGNDQFDSLDLNTSDNSGAFSQVLTAPLVFTGVGGVYTSGFDLFAYAEARSLVTGVTEVNFGNTLTVLGIYYTDLNGNRLDGTISSGLGFNYRVLTSVPVPGGLALLLSGLPGMVGYFVVSSRRRRVARQTASTDA